MKIIQQQLSLRLNGWQSFLLYSYRVKTFDTHEQRRRRSNRASVVIAKPTIPRAEAISPVFGNDFLEFVWRERLLFLVADVTWTWVDWFEERPPPPLTRANPSSNFPNDSFWASSLESLLTLSLMSSINSSFNLSFCSSCLSNNSVKQLTKSCWVSRIWRLWIVKKFCVVFKFI